MKSNSDKGSGIVVTIIILIVLNVLSQIFDWGYFFY